jgi:hypothetical protein
MKSGLQLPATLQRSINRFQAAVIAASITSTITIIIVVIIVIIILTPISSKDHVESQFNICEKPAEQKAASKICHTLVEIIPRPLVTFI